MHSLTGDSRLHMSCPPRPLQKRPATGASGSLSAPRHREMRIKETLAEGAAGAKSRLHNRGRSPLHHSELLPSELEVGFQPSFTTENRPRDGEFRQTRRGLRSVVYPGDSHPSVRIRDSSNNRCNHDVMRRLAVGCGATTSNSYVTS